jgi:hypothetical protein
MSSISRFKRSCLLGRLLLPTLLLVPLPSFSQSLWQLGENDPDAAAGSTANAETVDSVSARNLGRGGSGSGYSSDTPAGLGGLSMSLNGSGHFTASGEGFYGGIDLSNFEITCRV